MNKGDTLIAWLARPSHCWIDIKLDLKLFTNLKIPGKCHDASFWISASYSPLPINWLLKCIFLDVSFVLNIFIVLGLGSYGEPELWDHTLAGPHPSSSLNSEDLGKQLSAISHNLSCVCSTGTTEVTTSQCLTESSVR